MFAQTAFVSPPRSFSSATFVCQSSNRGSKVAQVISVGKVNKCVYFRFWTYSVPNIAHIYFCVDQLSMHGNVCLDVLTAVSHHDLNSSTNFPGFCFAQYAAARVLDWSFSLTHPWTDGVPSASTHPFYSLDRVVEWILGILYYCEVDLLNFLSGFHCGRSNNYGLNGCATAVSSSSFTQPTSIYWWFCCFWEVAVECAVLQGGGGGKKLRFWRLGQPVRIQCVLIWCQASALELGGKGGGGRRMEGEEGSCGWSGGRVKWGREEGGRLVCFLEMWGQSGLKAIQGLGRHNLLRQFIPFWYGPREKCHLPVLRCAGGDVIALVIVVPRAQPALRWLG